MSSLQTKKTLIEDSTSTELDDLAKALRCMHDKDEVMTWAEIDGVRRITKIETTSAALALDEGVTEIKLTEDFTYQVADPFDLVNIASSLVVTP